MDILQNFNLKRFNTFHVSAYARYFVDVTEVDHLQLALDFAASKSIPFMLIGQGSNLLFRENFPGLIIEMNIKGIKVVNETPEYVDINAMCGENWHQFVLWCLDHHYYGLENLSLIPGTIGAAPVQNIGAYGVEISEYLLQLEALEITSGKIVTLTKDDCEFAYRSSVFKTHKRDQYIITNITLRLKKIADINISYPALNRALQHIPPENISPGIVSETVCNIRSSKLPDHLTLGNAGSFFWNPVLSPDSFQQLKKKFPDMVGYPDHEKIKVPAAWLIEKAGWKGYRTGDVGVHQEHALVLVNYGKATGAELYELSTRIQSSVKEMFGIDLWPEVRII